MYLLRAAMTEKPPIPQNPCPVKGLVPWAGGVWPIMWRGQHPVLGWVYTIHVKNAIEGLEIHWNVSQEDIVQAMLTVARYTPGQYVQLGPMLRRRILARKWSFERGLFFYLLEGAREGREFSMAEDELAERIRSAEEEHA